MAADHFSVRPLAPETLSYCVGDVQYLPRLRDAYMRKCTAATLAKVKRESEKRVQEAYSPAYTPDGEHRKFGPWGH